jgi:ubiquinone/menaquinone biosynthesis C-methylase UbiE
LKALRCPSCRKSLRLSDVHLDGDEIESGKVVCEKGHSWTIDQGIPTLTYPKARPKDETWIKQYDEMAENYDEHLRSYDEWLGIDLMKERERLGNYVTMEGPSKIVDVSVGTGANLVALSNRFRGEMGRFNLHGLDMSRGMLRIAKRKFKELGINVGLVQGNVLNLPYQDDYFDLVIHSGGISTFSDKSHALEEMWRVAKPWGIVIVTDEGLSPELRGTERGKEIIKTNSLFGSRPPLEHVPSMARNLEVSYVLGGTFYQMVFAK